MKATTPLSIAVALAIFAGNTTARDVQPLRLPAGSGTSAAYGEISTGAGYEYVQFLGGQSTVGPLDVPFPSGGFAHGDFTREYAIAYPSGALETIDTSDAATALVAPTGLGGAVAGPRWDPVTQQSFVMTTDGSESTLYVIDLSTATTTAAGSAAGTAIVAIAIDASGAMYGFDALANTLVSVDTATGAVSTIGAVGTALPTAAAAMDTDPVTGLLYFVGFDPTGGAMDMFLLDSDTGQAVAIGPIADTPVTAFALARADDAVFADGFDGH